MKQKTKKQTKTKTDEQIFKNKKGVSVSTEINQQGRSFFVLLFTRVQTNTLIKQIKNILHAGVHVMCSNDMKYINVFIIVVMFFY